MKKLLSIAAALFVSAGLNLNFDDVKIRKGPTLNKYAPRPTRVRNPKIAEQVNAMHEKWLSAFKERKSA